MAIVEKWKSGANGNDHILGSSVADLPGQRRIRTINQSCQVDGAQEQDTGY